MINANSLSRTFLSSLVLVPCLLFVVAICVDTMAVSLFVHKLSAACQKKYKLTLLKFFNFLKQFLESGLNDEFNLSIFPGFWLSPW
jgi:hypothetical protein